MTRRAVLLVEIMLLVPSVHAMEPIRVAPFSLLAPGPVGLQEWQEILPRASARRTAFTLVEDDNRTVLRMDADRSASAISRAVRVDVRDHPMLAWRWKVTSLVEHADIRRKSGDDYPARLYVFFDYDTSRLSLGERARLALVRALFGDSAPAAALCYVWDTHAPAGTIVPNVYTDRVRMIVVESGGRRVGEWVGHERNVAEDFRAAFNEEAPSVSGIALAADTDDTGERAVSFFGDVEFRASPARR